jgi:hypothetical protein
MNENGTKNCTPKTMTTGIIRIGYNDTPDIRGHGKHAGKHILIYEIHKVTRWYHDEVGQ